MTRGGARAAWAGLAALTVCYGAGAALLHAAAVSAAAWAALYAAGVIALLALPYSRAGRVPARRWLTAAGLTVLLAGIFFGADGALDALNGARRAKTQVAAHLGGLELWFVLCPGAASVALAAAVRARLRGPIG